MPFRARREDGRVFVYTERAQRIPAEASDGTATTAVSISGSLGISGVGRGRGGGSVDGMYALVHANVPELDFAATASAYEFALAATLEVDICDPLAVLFPDFNHCHGRFQTLVVDANRAVAEASDEDLALDLF